MRSRHFCIAALALCAGSASAQSVWNNAAGGNWNTAANWTPSGVPSGVGATVQFPTLATPYEVLCNLSPSIDSIDITGPDQTLVIDLGNILNVTTSAGVVNNGLLMVNPSMSPINSALNFNSTSGVAAISGTGLIRLNGGTDLGDAEVSSVAGTALTLMQPVVGVGRIDGQGSIDNQSTIVADVAGMTLEVQGTITQTPMASMQGTNGLLTLKNATITGGQFLGGVEAKSGSTISNIVLTGNNSVQDSVSLDIASPGIQNNGVLTVNTAGTVLNAALQSAGAVMISGSGTIDLNGEGSDSGDAVLRTTAGNPIIVGVNQTVSGNGRIEAINEPITFRGVALADRVGDDLVMKGDYDFDMLGRAQSAGGTVLLLSASVTNGSLEGDVDSTGGSTIIDCQNTGTLRVRNNSTLNIEGSLLNSSNVVINHDGSVFNAIMRASADTAIAGTGTISLNGPLNTGDAQFDIDAGATLTVGANQVIEGTGRVDASGAVVMNGIYRGNVAGLDLLLTGTHDLSAGGQAEGTGGGLAVFSGADVTGGAMLGGVHTSGTTTMHGFNNAADFTIRENSTLLLDTNIVNNGTFTINNVASVFNAICRANQPVTINGTGTIVLNAVSGTDDAQLTVDGGAGGNLDLPIGQTIIGMGTLDGPMTIHGTVSPGQDDLVPQPIRLLRMVTLAPTAKVILDFEETGGVVSFDKFTGFSDVTLDGEIELRLQGGYEPAIGDRFTIVSATSVTGNFVTTTTPIIGTHLFRVIEQPTKVEALWTCLGDVNLDGLLDASDFSAWIAAFNSGDIEVGDQNLDGTLSPADFSAWIANFNSGC